MTADPTPEVLRVIQSECDWFGRYPPLPILTAESDLAPRWFGDLDRMQVAMALDEVFGIELPDAEVMRWASVRDVVASVKRLLPAGVAA